MPQYFFDVFDGVDFVDNEGVLYADLASVRREAVRAAGAMLRDHAADWDGKALENECARQQQQGNSHSDV